MPKTVACAAAVEPRIGRAAAPGSGSRRWRSALSCGAGWPRRAAAAKIAAAKPCQVVSPACRRNGRCRSRIAGRRRGQARQQRDGRRRRGRAARSGSRAGRRRPAAPAARAPRRSMVLTKLLPWAEQTQAVRRIERGWAAMQHRLLAGQLGGAVDAERLGRVVLAVGRRPWCRRRHSRWRQWTSGDAGPRRGRGQQRRRRRR